MFSRSKIHQILAVTILSVSFFGFIDVQQAAAIAADRVRIQTVDTNCTATPGTYRSNPTGDNVWSGWATDSDNWDPDCVRVWIDNAIEQQKDIRFCIQTSDGSPGGSLSNTACTPWASAGGGWSSWAADPDKWAYDSIRIKIDTQDLVGRYISSYRLGVQNSRATNDDCAQGVGTSAYTPMMGSGGGWSGWAPHALNEGSIACTRVNLDNVSIVGLPCSFNGTPVTSGNYITAAQSSSVPFGSSCVYENRTCTNGVLGGTYAYSTCSPAAAANCTFVSNQGNIPVNHDNSVTAYSTNSVAYGTLCSSVSQTRSCSNGTLSGTYANSTCSESGQTPPPTGVSASCAVGTGAVTMSWSSYPGATGYFPRIDPVPTSCPAGWARSGTTCYQDGIGGTSANITVPTSASYNVWVHQATASGGVSNQSTTVGVTCNPNPPVTTVTVSVNGGTYSSASPVNIAPGDTIRVNWSGTNSPTSCSKTQGPADFLVGATTGPDTTVAAPAPNSSLTFGVNCLNGGGNSTDTIVVTTRAYNRCDLNTVSVPHGSSYTFYDRNPVPYNTTCGAGNSVYALTRTCTDGDLSGSDSFNQGTCVPDTSQQPAVLNSNGFTGTVTVRSGSYVPITWNGINADRCTLKGSGGYVSTSTTIIATPTAVPVSSSAWVQVNQKTTFTLTCVKDSPASTNTQTATINMVPQPQEI